MSTPVSSTTASVLPVSSTTNPVAPSTTSGLSSVSSSLAPATDQGYSGQISACISSIFETIRGYLAKLPYIGYWFESTPVTTIVPPAPIPGSTTVVWTDAERVAMIRGMLPPLAAITTSTTAAPPVVPSGDIVNYLLGLFGGINSPAAKIEAFQTVLQASNSTDDIAKQFYDALPEGNGTLAASRSAFRQQIFYANNAVVAGGSSVYNGHDHGAGFGDHIVYHAIRGPLAQQAVRNLHAALVAPVSTTA